MKNVAVENLNDIINWFLYQQPMTHKKLQKLLYFSYGIFLTENNKDCDNIKDCLFVNRFEAWVHGPVDPVVYQIYKKSGINLISIESFDESVLNKKVLRALNKTMKIYSEYDADELEEITHNQMPWKKARKGLAPWESSNNRILDRDIFIAFTES